MKGAADMSLFRTSYDESIFEHFSDYTPVTPEMIRLHKITDEEYAHVPGFLRSRKRLLISPAGFWAVFLSGLSIIGELMALHDIILGKEKNAGAYLLIASMLCFSVVSFSIILMRLRLDRVVSRDAMVSVGQVTKVDVIHGGRGGITAAYHYIALHGSKQMVMINDPKNVVSASNTVLIVKSPASQYRILPLPSEAVDYSLNAGDNSEEIASICSGSKLDYTDYEKTNVMMIIKERVTPQDLEAIPKEIKSPSFFSQGATTFFWVLLSAGALIMIFFLIKSFKAHDMMVFAPLMAGFICEFPLAIWLTCALMKKPLPPAQTFCFDCIIVKAVPFNGKYMASVIVPQNKCFVDGVAVNVTYVKDIPMNIPVRIYFNVFTKDIRYIRPL